MLRSGGGRKDRSVDGPTARRTASQVQHAPRGVQNFWYAQGSNTASAPSSPASALPKPRWCAPLRVLARTACWLGTRHDGTPVEQTSTSPLGGAWSRCCPRGGRRRRGPQDPGPSGRRQYGEVDCHDGLVVGGAGGDHFGKSTGGPEPVAVAGSVTRSVANLESAGQDLGEDGSVARRRVPRACRPLRWSTAGPAVVGAAGR